MDNIVNKEEERSSGIKPPDFPNKEAIRDEYDRLLYIRTYLARELEKRIFKLISAVPSHPTRVKARVKSFKSYYRKYLRQLKDDVSEPPHITDVIGIRITSLFLEDLGLVENLIKKHFQVVEVEKKGMKHTFREFGYDSTHLLIIIPDDITKVKGISNDVTAEIQIRTILQDAWAEVEHELIYKAEFTPFDAPLKRKLAAVNASLSLADIIFQEIRQHQRKLNHELKIRRGTFYKKIEDSTDAILFSEETPLPNEAPSSVKKEELVSSYSFSESSIDDLLVEALSAHNKKQFDEAISKYSQIMDMKPDTVISSLIYMHRGMAFFARSHYEEAIADFSESFRLDPTSYKAAYYEGIVSSVLRRYPQAIDAFNKSLQLNSFQPYCLFRRGQVYYHLEDYPQALGDCESALALESFAAALKFKDLILSKLKM